MPGSVGFDRKARTWWWRYSETVGGVRRQPRGRGYRTKKEAEAALVEAQWQASQKGPAPPTLTVARYLAQRVEARAGRLALATLERYRRVATDHLEPFALGRLPIGQLDARHVGQWFRDLLDRGLSPVTVVSSWHVVAAHLRPLALSRSIPEEVLAVELPRIPRRPYSLWSPEQARRALLALEGDYLRPLVLVAVTTGLRAGELLALEWRDLQGGALLVERSVTWAGGRPATKEPKTHERRRVELYPETIACLEAHRAEQRKRKLLFPEWQTGDLVFPRLSGGYWKPQNLSTQFQTRLTAIDAPRIRWHDLRHTHASHLLAAGVPVTTVSARLGHATPQTTWRVYAHLVPGQQEEAVRKGAAYLDLTRSAQSCPLHPGKAGGSNDG